MTKKQSTTNGRGWAFYGYIRRATPHKIETQGTTTHKNKISYTQKQSVATTHSNKKTSLKITNKTKQKGETTHKKTTFYYLLIENMKNTYIIGVKEGQEPDLLQVKTLNDITRIGKKYWRAYIMENKQQAQETREKRYKQREERKSDPFYKTTYF